MDNMGPFAGILSGLKSILGADAESMFIKKIAEHAHDNVLQPFVDKFGKKKMENHSRLVKDNWEDKLKLIISNLYYENFFIR